MKAKALIEKFRIRGGSLIFLSILFFHQAGIAQKIIGIGTRYNDSFREWVITTDDEEVVGDLRMRWALKNDWTEWDLNLGNVAATMKQKWEDDPNLWEIKCDGIIVTARTTWAGEFSRWRLNDGKQQLTWESRYANQLDEWSIPNQDDKIFQVFTYREGDPREWVINDELPEDVSLAMRLAMIFLTLHFSTPRV